METTVKYTMTTKAALGDEDGVKEMVTDEGDGGMLWILGYYFPATGNGNDDRAWARLASDFELSGVVVGRMDCRRV